MQDRIQRIGDQLEAAARAMEIARSDPDPDRREQRLEIVNRALYAVLNEGVADLAQVVEEKAQRRSRFRVIPGGLAGIVAVPAAARQQVREHPLGTAATAGVAAAVGIAAALTLTSHTATPPPSARPRPTVTVRPPTTGPTAPPSRSPGAPAPKHQPPATGPTTLPPALQPTPGGSSSVIALPPWRPGRGPGSSPIASKPQPRPPAPKPGPARPPTTTPGPVPSEGPSAAPSTAQPILCLDADLTVLGAGVCL